MTHRHLTIFEGPDGSGKTTAAKWYAERTGARYVHFGPFPGLGPQDFNRMLVDAMGPALLGHQDVVFDRCWLSEVVYGPVHRPRFPVRTNPAQARLLSRLALRLAPITVLCLPPEEAVLRTFRGRRGEELLDSEAALRQVYKTYDRLHEESLLREWVDAPLYWYDYTDEVSRKQLTVMRLEQLRGKAHPVELPTAGNWDADVLLVGEKFTHHRGEDPLYQWPFGSLGGAGCSQWLSDHLARFNIPESRLLWVNADALDGLLRAKGKTAFQALKVVALGDEAAAALATYELPHATVPHPQYWKRFHAGKPYALGPLLNHLLGGLT